MSVRVLRGRSETTEADRAVSQRLLEIAAAGTPAVRVWRPHRQVAFGRRDARLEGYDDARAVARDFGFSPVERSVGGRAVAYDGETTLAFARAEPVADFRQGTDERYDRLTADLERAFEKLGVDIVRGEPADSFCPGTHSLSVPAPNERTGSSEVPDRRKIAGLAQRVQQDAALASGIVVVANRAELARVLEGVYGALGVPFDPDSVGAIADWSRRSESESSSADRVEADALEADTLAIDRAETQHAETERLKVERVRSVLEEALIGDRPVEAVDVA
ncbi:biotin/lipoate A/B protein ligase [Halostagnicola larsenii XH-48]|uniref:Biotin/lipoate A/B protein ligase n=1 Tax=Halostagnicola larsenii XH-48 TaxID=797299 RepID=W0JMJ4_9EURY|nr:lipoate--protein ligase family protein [Halostagnicola larsenii]AHF98531.1 biotin/lipoate A/B protein ligase [Halostagnicola larsenii XH-48]